MGICGSAAPNCTLYKLGQDPWVFEADPDTAGIGVLTAFVATSAVALCLSLAHTVITLHDHNGGYWIDVKLGDLFESHLKNGLTQKRRREVKAVLETVVLNLSDQQALVGLAMLLAGNIRVCSISVYHFTIVSDLGWFAANTHLVTMGVLQLHFRSHQVQRNWRFMLILMFFALMLAVSVLSAHQAWYDSYSSHAKCLFDDLIGNVRGEPALWMGINVFLLLVSYPSAMISLFEDLNNSYDQWLYIKPQKFLERQMKNIHSKYRALRYLKMILWGIPWCLHRILVIYDDSPVIACLFNIGWFLFGLVGALDDRWPSPAGENEMGFGQLVPIFLLISTVFVVREAWDDEVDKKPTGSISSLPDTTEDDHGSMNSGTHLMRQHQNIENLERPPRRVDTEQRIGMEPIAPTNPSNFARRRTGTVAYT